ncbi:MAG TPA: hypothetical protein VGD65_13385 [Chryseosolibacter sp.]
MKTFLLVLLCSISAILCAQTKRDSVYALKRHYFAFGLDAETAGKPAVFGGFIYSISPVASKQYHVGLRIMLHGEKEPSSLGQHSATDASMIDLTNRFFFRRTGRVIPMMIFNVGVRHFDQNVYKMERPDLNFLTAILMFPFSLTNTRTDLFSSSKTGLGCAVGYGALIHLNDFVKLTTTVDLKTAPSFERYQQPDRANLMLALHVGLGI